LNIPILILVLLNEKVCAIELYLLNVIDTLPIDPRMIYAI